MRKFLWILVSLALVMTLAVLPMTATAAGETVTATFDGAHADMTATAGDSITLPTVEGVALWAAEGRYYLPEDTYVLSADTAFTALLSDCYFPTMGYDSAALWPTTEIVDFDTPTGNYYSHFHLPGEDWIKDRVLVWNTSKRSENTHAYDETTGALTIRKAAGGNNFIQIFSSQSYPMVDGYSTATARLFSFDIQYTAGAFDGMKIGWSSWDTSTRIFINAKTDGTVMLGTKTVGSLQEGWNNIKFYIVAAEDGESCDIYCALNTGDTSAALSAVELGQMTSISSKSIVSAQAMETNSVLMIHIGENAEGDQVRALTLRNFQFYAMTRGVAQYVELDGVSGLLAAPVGGSLTLPAYGDVAAWKGASGVYPVGSQYTPTAPYVKLSAATAEEAAYAKLAFAQAAVAAAETNAARVALLPALAAALEDALVDETDERCIAAAVEMGKAIGFISAEIEVHLATAQAAVGKNAQARHDAIILALKAFEASGGFVLPDTASALEKAVNDYNSYVDSVNLTVAEACTTAVSVSVYRLPNTEIIAIIADIRSKIED